MAESWAQVVGWYCSKEFYKSQGNFGEDFSLESKKEGLQLVELNRIQHSFYTPIFIDLLDDFNQNNTSPSNPIDNISGFTIKQIEDILSGEDDYIFYPNGGIGVFQVNSPVAGV